MTTIGLREQHKRDRKEAIYNAAIKLYTAQGFADTTVVDIAKAANVSRGTVFNYYPYKEAILLEYFSHDFANLKRFTQSTDDPYKAIWEVIYAVADIVEAKREWMAYAAQELMHPDPERTQLALKSLPVDKIFLRLLQYAYDHDQVRTDFSLERLARTLTNVYFITALQWSIYHISRPLKEELDKAMTIAIDGLHTYHQS